MSHVTKTVNSERAIILLDFRFPKELGITVSCCIDADRSKRSNGEPTVTIQIRQNRCDFWCLMGSFQNPIAVSAAWLVIQTD